MNTPFNILHVEDESDDALLVRLALERAGMDCVLRHVEDGQEAVEYLSGQGAYEDRGEFPLPDLLLLDLKTPRLDGFQVLEWLRNRTDYLKLPVVVVSGSSLETDRQRAERLGALGYLPKTPMLENLIAFIRQFAAHRAI